MSVYQLPQAVCHDLASLITRFWWASNEQTKKIHWLSWQSMGAPKAARDMGFQDLDSFNLTLLAKQLWQIHSRPQPLVATIPKDKYLEDSNALEAWVK